MEVDSDDDFEKVSVPEDFSDAESDFLESSALKTLTRSTSTPATTQGTPFCREKRLKCPYDGCDKAFNRPTRLQEHIRSHTNERPFKCPHVDCGKDYLRESHLKHHLKSAHSDVRDYRCSFEGCGKAFATGQRLRVHEATHVAPNKYRCTDYPPCNQVFRKRDTLQKHIATDHKGQESPKLFECSKISARTGLPCTSAFDTASKLAAHDRTCHDPTRYSCDICVTLITTAGFDGHAQNANQDNAGYFTTYTELQEHIATEHPPQCHLCYTNLSTQRELSRHLEVDHGVLSSQGKTNNQIKCPHQGCEKVFTRVSNLNVHIRTFHEKRRDFVCGQTKIAIESAPHGTTVEGCGRAFAQKAALIDHVRTQHLGMETVQKAKRKAKGEVEAPKTKKVRKDKGIRKVPAISDAAPIQERFPFLDEDPDIYFNDGDQFASGAQSLILPDDAELDGNMVMYGSMIYDRNGAYRYADGEYPTSSQSSKVFNETNNDNSPGFSNNPFEAASPYLNPDLDADEEILNKPFTLEPEMSNALDPLLLVSTPSQQASIPSLRS